MTDLKVCFGVKGEETADEEVEYGPGSPHIHWRTSMAQKEDEKKSCSNKIRYQAMAIRR